MSKQVPAIEVRNLVKRFKSWEAKPERQLKTALISILKLNFAKSEFKTISVLDDISFSVQPGEFLGIMGRNGIGKSTILKLMSRIYVPSSGSIQTRGRVIPLLELGAGFDPALTGYENIFLNASILGFSKKTIMAALDQIIEFSELGAKINLLTQNYSSGMLVRLGFSIAVHMDFDILLLDEVLGVGDAGFTEKSIKKIKDLNSAGKTIVLVTHSPDQVVAHCSRCIVLRDKKIVFDGLPKEGAHTYQQLFAAP